MQSRKAWPGLGRMGDRRQATGGNALKRGRASTFFKAASIWCRVESWGGCARRWGARGPRGVRHWLAWGWN